MKSILLKDKALPWYLDLNDIFSVLGDVPERYNWLISFYECSRYLSEIPFGKEYVWIDGKRLRELIEKNRVQFIWGVFSAFEKDFSKEEILKYPLPDPEKMQGTFLRDCTFSHPLSQIEITAWDSSYATVLAKDDALIDKIRLRYPLGI